MKKFGIAIAIVATLVVALMSTGYVFAQGTIPHAPQTSGTAYGYGRGAMNNGGGMIAGRGGAGISAAAGEGILHDGMIAIYAEKLGISVNDLNDRLAEGETMAQIASSQGLTAEQFSALMTDARMQAIDQAVKDGTLTQSQADWLKTRGAGMAGANGAAARGAGRGMRGNGANYGTGDPTTCPYFTQTTP